ncbi:AAA family ATPase [Luteimonas sp. MJ246]|uniref:AAA family ATPase n=1 Tax=Luteimonas sp. MJ174 TaxID=3129237 RepID=UPI0031BA6CF9
MAHISLNRVAEALERLRRFHPFFGVTFLSMKETGVNAKSAIPWGSAQENEFLKTYYEPAGAPREKRFFVPCAGPDQESGAWKNPKYSGGSLQRARTTDQFKAALLHPTTKEWAFRKDYVSQLKALLPGSKPDDRIPMYDLIAWLYRDEVVPNDLSELRKRFIEQFKLDNQELAELFYESPEDPASFFFDEPINPDEFTQLIKGVPSGASFSGRTEADLLAHLVFWMKKKAKMILPDGFVESVYYSLKAQPFIVLAGRPGTAKTTFARAFAAALNDFFGGAVNEITVSIGKEFTEADVVGYEKISGDLASTELTKELFLSGRERDIFVIVLDEMNLSEVDSYFARILPAIESGHRVELPGVAGRVALPTETLVVGTVNSYLEEPSRMPLSGPVKRRANIIEMPNHLTSIVASGARSEFDVAAEALVTQSRDRIWERMGTQSEGVFDRARADDFDAVLHEQGALKAGPLMDLLWAICQATGDALTLGVLQDILDYVALSKEPLLVALDRQIARKVVPQLSGASEVPATLLTQLEGQGPSSFPEARAAISELLASTAAGAEVVIYKY